MTKEKDKQLWDIANGELLLLYFFIIIMNAFYFIFIFCLWNIKYEQMEKKLQY